MKQSIQSEALSFTSKRIGTYIAKIIKILALSPILLFILNSLKIENSFQITLVIVLVSWILLFILQKRELIINSEGLFYKKTFCGYILQSKTIRWKEIHHIIYNYRNGMYSAWGDIVVFSKFTETFYVGHYMTIAELLISNEQECKKIEKGLVQFCKANRVICRIYRNYEEKPIEHYFTILISLFTITIHSFAQVPLTTTNNTLRHGDILCKVEVPYVEAGERGEAVVWQLGEITDDSRDHLQAINSNGDTIAIYEEGRILHYTVRNDTLYNKGMQSRRAYKLLTEERPALRYPFQYGDSIAGAYLGDGRDEGHA